MKLKTKFQDEDFELGEVVEAAVFYGGTNGLKVEACAAKGGFHTFCFGSLKELTDMFEDYEEPKVYWYMSNRGDIRCINDEDTDWDNDRKQIGNYFETREQAEKAVEKLKAWQRLKGAGFEFGGWTHTPITKSLTGYNLHIKAYSDKLADYMDDLQLLFGGGE